MRKIKIREKREERREKRDIKGEVNFFKKIC